VSQFSEDGQSPYEIVSGWTTLGLSVLLPWVRMVAETWRTPSAARRRARVRALSHARTLNCTSPTARDGVISP
jgi:hypothetical protein